MTFSRVLRNLTRKLRPGQITSAGFAFTLALIPSLIVPRAYGEHTSVSDIVLVSDSLADQRSWNAVTPLLEKKGYKVTIVELPLASLKGDVDTVEQTLAPLKAPVVLVVHGYGGVVITEAGNDPKVARLVYIAAYAPDDNQSAEQLAKKFPPAPGAAELHEDDNGKLLLSEKGVEDDLAQDLSTTDKAELASSQRAMAGQVFSTPVGTAAWREKPSWFIVATNDRIISPELERDPAKAIHARTTVLRSGHVPMLSKPVQVAEVIESAAVGHGSGYKKVLVGIGTMGMSVPFYH